MRERRVLPDGRTFIPYSDGVAQMLPPDAQPLTIGRGLDERVLGWVVGVCRQKSED